jgi:adenine/guanine phosphoribosyltransferase-like PRPP-binding protein
MSTLTTTQASALVELNRRGALVPSASAFTGPYRQFRRVTLNALVDAGHARWEIVRNVPYAPAVASGIVPIDAPEAESPSVTPFKTNYMDVALDDLGGVIERAKIKLAGVDFDTLVGTGFSGSVVVPALALAMGKYFVLIRKPKDGSHHNGRAIGYLGQRWIFVDDFVATGATRDRVKQAVRACEYETGHQTVMVAEYHYARSDYEGDGSMGMLVKGVR